MYEFKNPSARGQAAIIAVLVWLVADIASTIGSVLTISALSGGVSPDLADSVNMTTGIAQLVVAIVTIVLVSMWIYRVNANAHTLSDSMTITPGWGVGWFFVPFANLWKPFEAMRETWRASVAPGDPLSVPTPTVMSGWWGLWIVTNILNNISVRLSLGATDAAQLNLASWISVFSFLLDLPLVYCLITMIRQLDRIQGRGSNFAETFA